MLTKTDMTGHTKTMGFRVEATKTFTFNPTIKKEINGGHGREFQVFIRRKNKACKSKRAQGEIV